MFFLQWLKIRSKRLCSPGKLLKRRGDGQEQYLRQEYWGAAGFYCCWCCLWFWWRHGDSPKSKRSCWLMRGVWSWQRTCARPLSAPLAPNPARPVPRRTAARRLAQWSEVWGIKPPTGGGHAGEFNLGDESRKAGELILGWSSYFGSTRQLVVVHCPVWRGCAIRPASGCKARFKAADYQAIYLEVWWGPSDWAPGGGLLPHRGALPPVAKVGELLRHLEPCLSSLPLVAGCETNPDWSAQWGWWTVDISSYEKTDWTLIIGWDAFSQTYPPLLRIAFCKVLLFAARVMRV